MKILFLSFLLLAGTAVAVPDLVVYIQSSGKIVSYDKDREIPKRDLTPDGHGFTSMFTGTNILGICSTTNAVAGKTNIVQLTVTIIDPKEHVYDYSQWTDQEYRMMAVIVNEINILRANAGLAPRTKKQVINALKDL